jgi:hypothetical protein
VARPLRTRLLAARAGRVGHAPGQAARGQARGHGAGQEHCRAAAGEVPDRLQHVRRLTLFEPRGYAVDAFGRLLGYLGGYAGLAALGRHIPQFVRHGVELVRGLLLLDGGLVAGLSARLAEQVRAWRAVSETTSLA